MAKSKTNQCTCVVHGPFDAPAPFGGVERRANVRCPQCDAARCTTTWIDAENKHHRCEREVHWDNNHGEYRGGVIYQMVAADPFLTSLDTAQAHLSEIGTLNGPIPEDVPPLAEGVVSFHVSTDKGIDGYDPFLKSMDTAINDSKRLSERLAEDRERFKTEQTRKILETLVEMRAQYLAFEMEGTDLAKGLAIEAILADIGRDIVCTGGLGELASKILEGK